MMANRLSGFLLVTLAFGFAGCGGDSLTLPPSTGEIEIITTTDGSELDPDGYTVQVDAQEPQAIETAGTLRISELTPGAHSVLLAGLSPNCTVAGSNPRTLTVIVGETITETFALSCGGTTGALEVTTQTTGPAPDADGYAISLDGTDREPIAANAAVTLTNLPPGSHVVGLTGLAANCSVEGDNLRAVTITTGQTETVVFVITCQQPPAQVGILRITTTTSGPDQDADGYRFAVDGGEPQLIGVNTATNLNNTALGNHNVVLSDVASNCSVDDPSESVVVAEGATATVAFNITCTAIPPATGSIRVSTSTSGEDQDNSYQFSIDGGPAQPIGGSGAQTITNIPAGDHTVELTGVAGNCSVNDASQTITVQPGNTAAAAFSISCNSVTGSIRVITSTSGESQDDAYQFAIDGGGTRSIAANDDETVGNISPGSHTVVLSGVADNCSVAGGASKSVQVTAGQTADVAFTVTCAAPQPSASESEVNVASDRIAAGQTTTITVRVRDVSGRRMVGATVSVTASGTGNQITPASAVTNSNGIATFTFSSTVAEDKIITATANGVAIDEKPVITVFRRSSAVQITSDQPDPSAPGQTITVTFTVAGEGAGAPTGTVDIFSLEEAGVGCTVQVSVGSCTFALNTAGVHHLQATYSGDSQFEGSFDPDGEEHLVNAAPTTLGEAYTGTAGAQLVVSDPGAGLLANDRDPEGDNTAVASHSEPSHGSLQLAENGTFIYTPRDVAVTSDMFSYTVRDVKGAVGNQANVTITLNSFGGIALR